MVNPLTILKHFAVDHPKALCAQPKVSTFTEKRKKPCELHYLIQVYDIMRRPAKIFFALSGGPSQGLQQMS